MSCSNCVLLKNRERIHAHTLQNGIYTLTLKIWDRLNEMRLFAFALLYTVLHTTTPLRFIYQQD